MTITITMSERVPGKEVVNGTVKFDTARLSKETDKGAFLLGIVHRLTARVKEEVKSKSLQPAPAPSHD